MEVEPLPLPPLFKNVAKNKAFLYSLLFMPSLRRVERTHPLSSFSRGGKWVKVLHFVYL